MASVKESIKEGVIKELLKDHEKEIKFLQTLLVEFKESTSHIETIYQNYIDESCGHLKKQLDENIEIVNTHIKIRQNSQMNLDIASLLVDRYNSCINYTYPSYLKLIKNMKGYSEYVQTVDMFEVDDCIDKFSYIEDIKKCSYEKYIQNKDIIINNLHSYYNDIIKY